MKFFLLLACFIGIAFVSSAPVEETQQEVESSVSEERAADAVETEERAADAVETEERAAGPAETEERAAVPAEPPTTKRPLNSPDVRGFPGDNFLSGIQEKGLISVRGVIEALTDKYLTQDGKALLKAFLPMS